MSATIIEGLSRTDTRVGHGGHPGTPSNAARQLLHPTSGRHGSEHERSEPKRLLWVDWGRNVRSRTLSRQLGVSLEEICCDRGRLWRYVENCGRTLFTIHKRRPEVLIATNPSIVLGLLLLVLRKWYGFRLVSDAHHCGVRAVNDIWLLQRLLDFYNARVDLVIVTNENHARFVASLGARAYVCQDPLPDISRAHQSRVTPEDRSVLLICSFDSDEPYEAAFEAFSSLHREGYILYVSGNYKKARTDVSRFPGVRFLGFLPTDQYYAYLLSVSVVLDLTTLEDCLVCGAYEALAAEKPLIVSKTAALSEYFGDAVVLTKNTADAIRESVLEAFTRRDELVQRAKDWVARNNKYMDEKVSGLRAFLLARDDPNYLHAGLSGRH
jgi:glycosyltransferase involved in cell wall biosynthesis